ncbi:lipase 1 [Saccharopolyspora subtropica]|uniref:Lipase 1 n=1 Tax=Saccharopolyspora thermophila TaxID=89367 RepID=A0A917JWG4_9PSEU|nr:lipase 1 [Saccharopolyspora subtropica]
MALAMASTALAAPAFAAPAAENYAAMGDSYASGVGTREYFDDSGDCKRSPKAYAQLWADSHDVSSFAFVACSGAVTDDVNSGQLDQLSADTTLVTISIGGNDIGFSSVIRDCLLGTDSSCDSAVSAGEEKARNELPGKLDTTYANIRQAAPNAKVVVVGYPRINEMGSCGIPGYTEAKRQRINEGADVLAEVIADRAAAAGFTYADTRDAFAGHGVCASDEWINGPSNPLIESFHPDVDGHAKAFLPVLNDITG